MLTSTFGARPAPAEQGVVLREPLRFEEELPERRVREVRARVVEHDLREARDLQRPRLGVVVDERDAAHLGVLVRGDRDFQHRLDGPVAAAQFGLVRREDHLVVVGRRPERRQALLLRWRAGRGLLPAGTADKGETGAQAKLDTKTHAAPHGNGGIRPQAACPGSPGVARG